MKRLRHLAAALACAAPLAAAGQWLWVDADGRKVFSDRPPPVDVPPQRILRQPGGRAPADPAATPAATPAVAAPVAAPAPVPLPRPGRQESALQERIRQAEAAEAAKKKSEAERVAQRRAENCQRARQAKATLESGVRLAVVNAQGEREILDDAARSREAQRVEAIIASDCAAQAQ